MNDREVLCLATSHGIAICAKEAAGWQVIQRELQGASVTSIVINGDIWLAATRVGIFRSDDAGISWRAVNQGLSIRQIRWIAADPDQPRKVCAGTEPAGIFLSRDGGISWKFCSEVAEMRQQLGWYLPYSPEAGCVRSFAFSGLVAYAAVEVGGILVSRDQGVTWNLGRKSPSADENIHPDVHAIITHPSSGDLVAATTGGGLFISADAGETWVNCYPDCYCRAAWWDPKDPGHMLVGSADWVDRNGRIEMTWDGGVTWQDASRGLDLPWRNHMVERFTQVGAQLLAVLSNGELFSSPLDSIHWQKILPEVHDINAVAGLSMKV